MAMGNSVTDVPCWPDAVMGCIFPGAHSNGLSTTLTGARDAPLTLDMKGDEQLSHTHRHASTAHLTG